MLQRAPRPARRAGGSSTPDCARWASRGTPWGALWRAVDTIREHRGDSHIAAWIATGLDPVEIGLLTEIYYGMPNKRYHRGRGWAEADLDAGLARLRDRGLVDRRHRRS